MSTPKNIMNTKTPGMSRRQFLRTTTSTAALWMAAHTQIGRAASLLTSAAPGSDQGHRIESLRLSTAVPLHEMEAFYHDLLGLPVLEKRTAEVTFAGGLTPITFVKSDPADGNPFYHVAFNIPENKLLAAHDWQKERTALLPPRENRFDDLHDADFPDDVIHFKTWNSHSVFFLDPAGSLIEYIARHDLGNGAEGSFSTKDILYASEIGFVVDDVAEVADGIKKEFSLDNYRGVWTVGDEYGLLLVLSNGHPWGSVPGDRPKGIFPTSARIRGKMAAEYKIPGYPYEITVG